MPPLGADNPVGERIAALDVLRGIALLGMFLVHFHMFASGPGSWPRLSSAYDWVVTNLFEERFWTMFGILFGAGFAVQLRRAEARGASFAAMYLRRIAALAAFGFIAHAIFGFNVLLGYAAWGVPLLLIRRWSIRALIIALVLSAMSGAIYSIAYCQRPVWPRSASKPGGPRSRRSWRAIGPSTAPTTRRRSLPGSRKWCARVCSTWRGFIGSRSRSCP